MLKNYERAATSQAKAPETSIMDMLGAVIRFLRRQWKIVLTITIVFTSLGLAYAVNMPRIYTARALLVTDAKKLQLSESFGEATIDPLELETQAEILKSENVLMPVVKELKLTRSSRIHRIAGASRQALRIRRGQSADPWSSSRRYRGCWNSFSASRIPRTRIIELSFKAREPAFAAEVVNAIAEFVHSRAERGQDARGASSQRLVGGSRQAIGRRGVTRRTGRR